MKKKLFYTVLVLVFVVCCALSLIACNDDRTPPTVPVTSVTLNETEITLTEGESASLTATVKPSNATDSSLEWTTSDPRVATVEDGTVYAVGEGSASVTVTSTNGKSATCSVTVEAEAVPPTKYTVTFHAQGGKFEDGKEEYAVTVDEFDVVPEVIVTREEGTDKYDFTTWYYDEYRTRLWTAGDAVTDDIDLYAGWKYLTPYQSVIDALADRIKTERENTNAVEILSVFTVDGYLCFLEKDLKGVFSYRTDVPVVGDVKENANLIAKIPDATLSQLNAYNDTYTSDSNFFRANYMAWKYTDAESANSVVYACVSDWEDDGSDHYPAKDGPWYRCNVKAVFADENGRVFECSFTVVAGIKQFDYVINGTALSQEYDLVVTPLGELANDYYAERVKELEA